jgi:hypothetical protein
MIVRNIFSYTSLIISFYIPYRICHGMEFIPCMTLLNWIKEVVGKPELNACFTTQHKQVGTCHFTKGITHINQMTGCEH